MPLCCDRHVGQVAIGNVYYVIMLGFFLGRFDNIWGREEVLGGKKTTISFDGAMWHFWGCASGSNS